MHGTEEIAVCWC